MLEVPLYQGGKTGAAVAKAAAGVKDVRANLALAELELREAVRSVWEELSTLTVQREEARALGDYRELYLDRSRALYEMEVKTDLGDSMVRITEARLKADETEYQLALAWARLDALRGQMPGGGAE